MANTDNRSDIYFYHMYLAKLSLSVLALFYGKNVIRVCKINWPINRLIITNADVADKTNIN